MLDGSSVAQNLSRLLAFPVLDTPVRIAIPTSFLSTEFEMTHFQHILCNKWLPKDTIFSEAGNAITLRMEAECHELGFGDFLLSDSWYSDCMLGQLHLWTNQSLGSQ